MGEETIKKLSTYLLALLCSCMQRKFGIDIQKITMTPANAKILHIAAPEVFVSYSYPMAKCTSAATSKGKVIVNGRG